MSFILDALRKSDARRRMGQTPALDSAPSDTGRPPAGRRHWSVLGLVAVLIASLVVVLFLNRSLFLGQVEQWTANSPSPEQAIVSREPDPAMLEPRPGTARTRGGPDLQESGTTEDMERETIVRDPAEFEAELARLVEQREAIEQGRQDPLDPQAIIDRRARRVPQPRTAVVAESPDRDHLEWSRAQEEREQERVEQLIRSRGRQRREPPDTESVTPTSPAQSRSADGTRIATAPARPDLSETTEPWSPQASEYVRAWELPLSIRRNMPEMKLSIHVFSPEPERRFVLVNGERFVVGDTITDGVRLVDIRREGAIVDFRDYRFLLEP